MVRVPLTGFAPFDGAALNPSWEAARLAAATPPDGFSVTAVELPCVFGDSIAELHRGDGRHRPAPRRRRHPLRSRRRPGGEPFGLGVKAPG